jgi:cytochrome bd-type quinol oxidase subunit 2
MDLTVLLLSRLQFRVPTRRVPGVDRAVPDVVSRAVSLWPMINPHHSSPGQAESSPYTQAFLLIGMLVLLPVILMYTAWCYWVFGDNVRSDIGCR